MPLGPEDRLAPMAWTAQMVLWVLKVPRVLTEPREFKDPSGRPGPQVQPGPTAWTVPRVSKVRLDQQARAVLVH